MRLRQARQTVANWSLERKLPLVVSTLLLLVVLVLTMAAYEEVRRSTRAGAAARLERSAAQYADLFQQSLTPRLTETAALAADPAIRDALAIPPGGPARAAAAAALRRVAPDTASNIAVEVQDASGRVVLRAGAPDLHAGPPVLAPGDSATIGPLQQGPGGALFYEIRAAVRHAGRERAAGQVVQLRRVTLSAQARQRLTQLIGGDIALLLGNADGPPWTDLGALVESPPAEVRRRAGAGEYRRGEPKVGAATVIRGTPWAIVVELPRHTVFAPASAYLERMTLIALAVVLLGAIAARWVGRRITTPLRHLTTAAAAIANGDWDRQVDVAGGDEAGRLAQAFNAMVARLADARRRLETEVTERTRELEQAKERLEHTSEERYRTLFHLNPLPMWLYDPVSLAFLDVNDAAVRHYGYSRAEFLAMTIRDIRPPEEVGRLLKSLGEGPPGSEGAFETGIFRHRMKDGTLLDAEVSRQRLELGGRTVVLVLANDVTPRLAAERALRELAAQLDARVAERTQQLETANRRLEEDMRERRRAEDSVRTSEERFRALAETANDAIVSADSRGVIQYFNRAAERTFGYPATVAIGQPLTLLMPPRLRAAHRAGFARFLETGEPRVVGRSVEVVGQRRDGTEFPVELSLACWRTAAGPSFTGILRDISDRKRVAEQLARDAEELQRANQELEAFSYSVSHDLRAPLRAIHGFARILLEDHAPQLDEEARRLLGVIDENTRRMGQLIDDLLAFSRLGRKELETARVDMTDLARGVAAELQRVETERPPAISIAPLPPARGDRSLLRQAFANLLQNAIKFSRGSPEPRVEVGTLPDENGQRVYYVKDNGVGFDMRYAAKLFGVFQRLHSDAEFEGTGVGLATVQRIVHRHGGRVWAEAKVGAGATFYFTIPGSGEE